MGIRETLKSLLQGGKIRQVKMTKTVIEHDASQCTDDCALCQQVTKEIADFWKRWNVHV